MAVAGDVGVTDTVTRVSASSGLSWVAVTVVVPPFSAMLYADSDSVTLGVSSSVMVRAVSGTGRLRA